jgi:hypothetical protein
MFLKMPPRCRIGIAFFYAERRAEMSAPVDFSPPPTGSGCLWFRAQPVAACRSTPGWRILALMGTKSRESIYGSSVRHSAERAAEARKEPDRLACVAWNQRMLGFKGPAQPSPSLGNALNARYLYLEVRCLGCDTHQTVALGYFPIIRPRWCVSTTAIAR